MGEATTCAVYPDARNEFAHPDLLEQGLAPWVVREMWFSGGPDPDHRVDVTDVFDRKLAALRAHVTQTSHMSNLEDMLRERLSALSQEPGRLAEAFTHHPHRVAPAGT